ncbi:MAG: hypothetical protein NVS2B16_31050 [Chloroflexota bacterium]
MTDLDARHTLRVLAFTLAFSVGFGAHSPVQAATERVAATTALRAVRVVVHPYFVAGYNFSNCTRRSPRLYPSLTCPETARLRRRLESRRPIEGLPFCRCESGPKTVRVWQISNDGRVALVNAYWNLGPGSFTGTFVVRWNNGWLVDDEYCAGRPATTIYGSRGAVPCR